MIKTAKDIYEYLERHVVGQEEAKKSVAYAGYIHQLRMLNDMQYSENEHILARQEHICTLINEIDEKVIPIQEELKKVSNTLRTYGNNPELDRAKRQCAKRILDLNSSLDYIFKNKDALMRELDELPEPIPQIPVGTGSSLMLMGPSGCGKTYLVQKLAEYLDLPFIAIDMTQITATGWQGDDIVDQMRKYVNDNKEHPNFEYGIIFLDEVDKICEPAVGKGGTDHNKNTQYSLLKVLEGIEIGQKPNPFSGISEILKAKKPVNTKTLLFMLAGSFNYVEEQLKAQAPKASIGFNNINAEDMAKSEHIMKKNLHLYLQKHNVATELIGRISMVTRLEKLTKEQIKEAFIEKENNLLEQYEQILGFASVEEDIIEITDEDIDSVVDECYTSDIGARGLHAALDRLMKEKMFK